MKIVESNKGEASNSSISDRQQPIRVLFIIGSLPIGGAENQVVTLASTINGDRYNVRVCCLRSEGVLANILKSNGIPVVSLNLRLRSLPIAVYKLYKLTKTIKPQIVHTHLTEADLWGRLVAKLAGVLVIITTIHGRYYWRKPKLRLFIDQLINHITDKVITVTDEIRQSYIKLHRISIQKIITIPNTVDIDRFGVQSSRNELRNQLGVKDCEHLIGTVARLEQVKRLDQFLEAARAVCDVVSNVKFIIVGDGPLREELESQAWQLNLVPQFVSFLGSRKDIPDLLSAMDYFVLSSESEGLPVALLEAMAASKPIIASRVGGIPEVIQDGYNGLLVSAHDPTGLAKAILRLIEDPGMCEAIGGEAYRTAVKRFSTEVVGQQITAIYASLLKKKWVNHGK
jgi:glycosyltransferase involved in cell wall biosynthesis